MFKSAVTTAVALLAVLASSLGHADESCKGWIFFDLGNTVVDTRDSKHTVYLPGAREYITALAQAGYHLGLISNVPDTWGNLEQKLVRLKADVNGSWAEAKLFEWDRFEVILLPPSDSLRKPDPFLFKQALSQAAACRGAYLGENAKEIKAATDAGFAAAHLVGWVPGATAPVDFPALDKVFP